MDLYKMSDVSKKKSLFDATFSWNGYVYQGNVGLYVCLFEIDKKLKEVKTIESLLDSLQEYSIEYEWLEDFSIKEKHKYLSLHQVKNYPSQEIKDYIEAIETILNRKNKIISVNDLKSYLQVKKPKKADKNYINDKVSEVLKLLVEIECLDKNLKFNDAYDLEKFNIIDVNKEYVEDFFKEFKEFTDNAFQDSKIYLHSSKEIQCPDKTLENYEISKIHDGVLHGKKSLSDLSIYMNFDSSVEYNLALGDKELDEENIKLIRSIISGIQGESALDEIDIDMYYFALQEHVRKNIQQRHMDIKNKLNQNNSLYKCEKKSINFKIFIDTLSQKIINQNEEYWKVFCRKKFKKIYDDHMEFLLQVLQELDGKDKQQIEKFINNIEVIGNSQFDEVINNDPIGFLQKISCDVIRDDNVNFYEEISEKNKITENFFNFIQEIETVNSKFQYKCQKSKIYQPTSISFRDTVPALVMKRQLKSIQSLIKNHDNGFVDLKDINYLIVSVDSLFEDKFNNVSIKIPSIIDGELPSEDLITEDKVAKFISNSKAIKELS